IGFESTLEVRQARAAKHFHVAIMSRGDAGTFWKSLENNENKQQHAQHEKRPAQNECWPRFCLQINELNLAGELGFEPRFSESESDVLPLNYSPMGLSRNGASAAIKKPHDMGQFHRFDKSMRRKPAVHRAGPTRVATVTTATRLKAATARNTKRG